MNINNQLLGLLQEMSQEQQALLCQILTAKPNNVNDSFSIICECNELLKTKSNLTTSMLRLVFECHENNVNSSTVFEALSPFFLLIDNAAN